MRLLDARTLVHEGVAELEDFPDERKLPPYAILSHTWAEDEVLFHDLERGPDCEVPPTARCMREWRVQSMCVASDRAESHLSEDSPVPPARPRPRTKIGWNKVLNTCMRALRHGLDYVWIDTCCIDKTSSAELSEAINSMYRWYQRATVCYVYLADCERCPDLPSKDGACPDLDEDAWLANQLLHAQLSAEPKSEFLVNLCAETQLSRSRWFTRGWTLQELIAPEQVWFFDCNWQFLFTKIQVLDLLTRITGIQRDALAPASRLVSMGDAPWMYSVAQRMNWASKRKTTRVEDEAYCLLGIFGISMPLLYGEGSKAFQRLQEEIVKNSTDQSIFAWEFPREMQEPELDLDAGAADVYLSPETGLLVVDGVLSMSPVFHAIFAPSPACFGGRLCAYIVCPPPNVAFAHADFSTTNRGLRISLPLGRLRYTHGMNPLIAVLGCRLFLPGIPSSAYNGGYRIAMYVKNVPGVPLVTAIDPQLSASSQDSGRGYRRLLYGPSAVRPMPRTWSNDIHHITEPVPLMIVSKRPGFIQARESPAPVTLAMTFPVDWTIKDVHPASEWSASIHGFEFPCATGIFGAVVMQDGHGCRCTVLVTALETRSGSEGQQSATRSVPKFSYWLFHTPEGPAPDTVDNHDPYHLAWLCRHASSLPWSDDSSEDAERARRKQKLSMPCGSILCIEISEKVHRGETEITGMEIPELETLDEPDAPASQRSQWWEYSLICQRGPANWKPYLHVNRSQRPARSDSLYIKSGVQYHDEFRPYSFD